jgi:uncharacterized repeat protein (TIGR03803 family)
VSDTSGNLYGTTQIGGSAGYGIVFELSPPAAGQKTWSETILHSFQGGADGSAPNGGLVFDTAGNLYGTTSAGGSANAGTVFKLTPPASGQTAWSEAVLYAFQGGTDGLNPAAGLTLGRNGVLYGTTQSGGAYGDGSLFNGTVFELTPPKPKQTVWTETILHSFNASTADGGGIFASVALGKKGVLYGATIYGGSGTACIESGGVYYGCGTVFRLTPPAKGQTRWSESLLYSFGNSGGFNGVGVPLVADSFGDLYGEASNGGAARTGGLFKLSNPGSDHTPWAETDLADFPAGSSPAGGLALYRKNLFGASYSGGTGSCNGGCGYAFELDLTTDALTATTDFPNGSGGGESPSSGLIFDAKGNAYGTTSAGGQTGNGAVFEITK